MTSCDSIINSRTHSIPSVIPLTPVTFLLVGSALRGVDGVERHSSGSVVGTAVVHGELVRSGALSISLWLPPTLESFPAWFSILEASPVSL